MLKLFSLHSCSGSSTPYARPQINFSFLVRGCLYKRVSCGHGCLPLPPRQDSSEQVPGLVPHLGRWTGSLGARSNWWGSFAWRRGSLWSMTKASARQILLPTQMEPSGPHISEGKSSPGLLCKHQLWKSGIDNMGCSPSIRLTFLLRDELGSGCFVPSLVCSCLVLVWYS